MAGNPDSWSAQQLTEFLALLSSLDDSETAMTRGLERVTELFDAEAAAIASPDGIEAAYGFPPEFDVAAGLAFGHTEAPELIGLEGIGPCHAASVPVPGDRERRLSVVRAGEPFDGEELALLRGIARVLGLGLMNLSLLQAERTLREDSQRRVAENARLLDELRERQRLLERLAQLQRAIVERHEIHEILGQVARTAADLLGDQAAGVRLLDPADRSRTILVASAAGSADAEPHPLSVTAGIGGRAMTERRLAVADAASASYRLEGPSELGRPGVRAALAAPVYERGEVAGALLSGSSERGRVYGARDQQVILAHAEHASLALNHARAVEETVHEALHDSLTGLPNRVLFLDRAAHAVARADRTGIPVGVLFCDLDSFKTINDSLGHGAGDHLLAGVAERLHGAVRPADTIARLGGDEFAVLVEELRDPGEAARVARRVLEALEAPFDVRGREVYLSASIGIAAGVGDAETLLRNADLAMYRAKGRGPGRYAVFEPEMHRAVVERMELEVDLKRAIERQELLLVYQPVCQLATGAVVGLEALVRWRHPTRGLVRPDSFIPLAERSGQIDALGRWVLRAACQQAALWRARYPAHGGLQVGVNISGVQLREGRLALEVSEALDAGQLDAAALTLEVTETVLMQDFDEAVRQLEEVKALGVHVAVDDFGVGYSSLRYLRRLPLDNLKIDKSFIAGIGQADEEPALLRAIVDLAEIFGLEVVAEGIESDTQRRRLVELGCEMGQGHLFSEALEAGPADAFLLGAGLLGRAPAGPAAAAEAEGGRRGAD